MSICVEGINRVFIQKEYYVCLFSNVFAYSVSSLYNAIAFNFPFVIRDLLTSMTEFFLFTAFCSNQF